MKERQQKPDDTINRNSHHECTVNEDGRISQQWPTAPYTQTAPAAPASPLFYH